MLEHIFISEYPILNVWFGFYGSHHHGIKNYGEANYAVQRSGKKRSLTDFCVRLRINYMFTRFTKIGYKSIKKYRVTIWSRGIMGFSRAFIRKNELNKYKYLILYYEKDLQKIGVSFTNNESESGIIKITKNKSGTLFVCIRAFINYYGLKSLIKRKFEPIYNEGLGIFILNEI